MRNDLRRACRHCALRLPEGSATCPRCRSPTTTPAQALESLAGAKQSLRVDRPLRDALIHVPAALLYVAGAVAGIYASAGAGLELGDEGGALVVALVVLLLPTVFSATVVVLAVPWAVWAAVVALVSWISSRRKPRSVLRPAPFATVLPDLPIRASWFDRGKQWLRRHWLRKAALGFAGLFLVELVAELRSKNPFGGAEPVGALEVAVGTILFQLVVLAILAIPLRMVLQGLVSVQGKLERLAHVFRERRRDRALWDPAAGTEPVGSGDYRTATTRRVLEDADGLPVLVERA